VAVVVAPVVGPTLGGWLADNYSGFLKGERAIFHIGS
jgi:hypothetical protein